MEVEPVVDQSEPEVAETEIDTEEQSEQLETEPITAADVAPEKPSKDNHRAAVQLTNSFQESSSGNVFVQREL